MVARAGDVHTLGCGAWLQVLVWGQGPAAYTCSGEGWGLAASM